jgi:hypothetical protein
MLELISKEDEIKTCYTRSKKCSKCGSKNVNPSLTEKDEYGKRYHLCDKCDRIKK